MENILRVVFWPKRIAYILYLIPALVIANQLDLKGIKIGLVFLPLLAIDGLLRIAVTKNLKKLEQLLMATLEQGNRDQLLPLFNKQKFLHFAAPKSLLFPKLGLIYEKLNNPALAIEAYSIALEETPPQKALPILTSLADCLYKIGELEKAERYYREAVEIKKAGSSVYAKLAQVISDRNINLDEAEFYLETAIENNPTDGVLHCELIKLLVKKGQLDKAKEHLILAKEKIRDEEREKLDEAQELLNSAIDKSEKLGQ